MPMNLLQNTATTRRRRRSSGPDPIAEGARKRVKFCESSELFVVPDLSRSADGGSEGLWYSPSEQVSFKTRYIRSVCQLRAELSKSNGEGLATEVLGLEKQLSSDLAREFRRRRQDVHKAVEAEQMLQRTALRGGSDPDRLAAASRCHSRWAVERARAAATLLEQDLMLERRANASAGLPQDRIRTQDRTLVSATNPGSSPSSPGF